MPPLATGSDFRDRNTAPRSRASPAAQSGPASCRAGRRRLAECVMSRDRLRGDRFATLTIPTAGQVPVATALLMLSLLVATPLLVQAAAAWATTGRLAWPTRLGRHGHPRSAARQIRGGPARRRGGSSPRRRRPVGLHRRHRDRPPGPRHPRPPPRLAQGRWPRPQSRPRDPSRSRTIARHHRAPPPRHHHSARSLPTTPTPPPATEPPL